MIGNYALVIDISSDEENNRYSTPIKTLDKNPDKNSVNMVGRLNLSVSSVEVWRGIDANLESPQTSTSTFNSEPEEAFPSQKKPSSSQEKKENEPDDNYEEPDSSRDMPELTPAPVLKDITIAGKPEYPPPTKAENLDDLSEPSVREIEDSYGFILDEREIHCLAGRGNSFTSASIQRLRKQPVRVIARFPIVLGYRHQEPEVPCHDPLPVCVTLAVKEFTNLQPDFAKVDTTYEEESKYLTWFS